MVPIEINGKPIIPFMGLGKHRPHGKIIGPSIPTCLDFPEDGNKTIPTLKEALQKVGLKDGIAWKNDSVKMIEVLLTEKQLAEYEIEKKDSVKNEPF